MNKVSVIIPTMKGRAGLLYQLLITLPEGVEVIIVDDEDLLLAAKRNKGARQASGEYLLFIDDDNYLDVNAIFYMLFHAKKYGILGMVACYQDKPNLVADGGSKRNYLNGFTWGMNTNRFINELGPYPYEVDEVANAFMIKRSVFEFVGGFDEKNFPIDLDEADICKRIKNLGYKIMMCPRAICYHKSQTYSRIADFRRPLNAYYMGRNKVLFQKKHTNLLKYGIYILIFLPLTLLAYAYCLLIRRKPVMFFHFMRGVLDGLFK